MDPKPLTPDPPSSIVARTPTSAEEASEQHPPELPPDDNIAPKPWIVLTQTHPASLLPLTDRWARAFGPGQLFTGMIGTKDRDHVRVSIGPPYDQSKGLSARARSWLLFALWAATRLAPKLLSVRRPALLVNTNPPLLPHLGWFYSVVTGAPLALLIWDVYPDHLIQAGTWSEHGLAARIFRRLNQWAFQRAQIVVTLSEGMRRAIIVGLPARFDTSKIITIPFWVDATYVRPLPKSDNELRVQFGVEPGDVVILYAGNIGATHDLTKLVSAAATLQNRAKLKFLIVGKGLGRAALEALAFELGAPNLTFHDPVAFKDLPRLLALGDIAVVSQNSQSAHLSLPSKTYSAMAAGSAILALTPAASSLEQLILGLDCGVAIPPDDESRLRLTIEELLDAPDRLARLRVNARRAAVERFDISAVHQRLTAELTRRWLPRSTRTRPSRLLLLLIGSLFLLVLGEILLRWMGVHTPVLYDAHPRAEYVPQANQDISRFGRRIRYNAAHMRSAPLPISKTAQEFRVLVIGDSVINGGSLTDQSELASSLLEADIASRFARPAFVGNVSAGSWGPANQLAYLEEWGTFEADAFIVVWSTHDLHDAPTFTPLDESTHPTARVASAWQELWRHFLHPRLIGSTENRSVRESERHNQLGQMRALLTLLARTKKPRLLCFHPTTIELTHPDEFLVSTFQRLATERGADFLDLTPHFARAMQKGHGPFRPDDPIHPSALGQAVYAEAWRNWLEAKLSAPIGLQPQESNQ